MHIDLYIRIRDGVNSEMRKKRSEDQEDKHKHDMIEY